MRIFRHGWIIPVSYAWRWRFACALTASALVGNTRPATAQRVVRAPEQVVSVSKGASALLVNTTAIQRFSIGDPAVAEAVVVSPTEILINGKTLGTTSLFLWDNTGTIKLYSIEVTACRVALAAFSSVGLHVHAGMARRDADASVELYDSGAAHCVEHGGGARRCGGELSVPTARG